MAPNVLIHETEELNIKDADFTELRFVISFRGQEFTLVGLPGRLNVFVDSEDQPAGYVKRGSAHSGAIWSYGRCVADYVVEQDGRYLVTEIKETFRHPETEVESDPVLFLLTSLSLRSDVHQL